MPCGALSRRRCRGACPAQPALLLPCTRRLPHPHCPSLCPLPTQPLQALLQAHRASLGSPGLLPLRAARTLGLCLSDLSLRCWPAQPAAQFDAEARSAAFAAVAGPLVQLLQAAAVAGASGGEAAAAAVRQAAAVATSVLQSCAGTPKPLRSIAAAVLVSPALASALELLRGGAGSSALGRHAAAALLRLITCALEVLPTEIGADGAEQLLGALVQAFSAAGARWGRCPRAASGELTGRPCRPCPLPILTCRPCPCPLPRRRRPLL